MYSGIKLDNILSKKMKNKFIKLKIQVLFPNMLENIFSINL